jgi:hypothetical protein
MLKIYLASQYSQKEHTLNYARRLDELPHVSITSRWVHEPHDPYIQMHELDDHVLAATAMTDLQDIMASNTMVFFSQDPSTYTMRGGRHVEFGVAIAIGCLVCVIGPRENIFHYLDLPDRIKHFETEHACFDFLQGCAD